MGRGSAGLLQRPLVPADTPEDGSLAKPAVLTVEQAARAIKMSKQYIYGLLNADPPKLKAKRHGRSWRIDRKDFCEKNDIPEDHDFGD